MSDDEKLLRMAKAKAKWDRLRDKAPELLAMLRELEWAGGEAVSRCPECGARPERTKEVYGNPIPGKPGFVEWTGRKETIPGGHTSDCRLKLLLAECGEP